MKTSTWDTTVPKCSDVDAFWWSAIWCCKCKSSAHRQFAAGFVLGKECMATCVRTSSSSCVVFIHLLHSASLFGCVWLSVNLEAKLVVKQSKNGSGCTSHTMTQHKVDFFFYKGPALFKKLKLRRCPTVFHQNLSYDFLADVSVIDLRFLGSASHYHWEKYPVKWWSGHLLSPKSSAAAVDVGSQFIQREPFPWLFLRPKLFAASGGKFLIWSKCLGKVQCVIFCFIYDFYIG